MQDRIFGDREKAMEADYFRKEEAKLLEKLRQRANLDEIAAALRDKLQVDNPELLATVRDLGVTADNATAFLLLPLVQVAWAEGKVRKDEHEAVMKLAHERGVEEGSAAEQYLRDSIINPSDFVVPGFPDAMQRNLGDKLTGDQINDIIAFLLTQK